VHGVGSSQGRGAGLRQPQVAHLAGLDELRHGSYDVLDRYPGVDPVLVQQVDPVGPEPAQGLLDDLADVLRTAVQPPPGAGGLGQVEAELGGQHDLVAPGAAEDPSEQFFVGVRPIDFGGVEQRHPGLDSLDQGCLALGCVGPGLVNAGHPHAAETEGGNFQALLAELAGFHQVLQWDGRWFLD
jgi:hypothetical protein